MTMLHKKIFVCLLFLMFISVTITPSITTNTVTDTPTTTLTVSPTSIVGPTPDVNDTFKIYVNVENVTNLIGYQIGLKWNPTVLNCTSVTYNNSFITGITIDGTINNTAGEINPPYGLAKGPPGVNGSGTLLNVFFKVKAPGESPIDFILSQLADLTGEIPSAKINGTFSLPDEEDPVISDPEQNPVKTNVMPNQTVTVSVNVTDNAAVQSVILSYSNDSGTNWYNVTMSNPAGDTWEGDIPGHPEEASIQYMIIAYDTSNNSAVNDNAGAYHVYTVIPEFPTALIVPMLIVLLAVAVLTKKLRPRS